MNSLYHYVHQVGSQGSKGDRTVLLVSSREGRGRNGGQ